MKILQCEIHKCQTNPYDDDPTQCLAATHVLGVTGDCRMVPMRLIPDNAETVERIVTALERSILIGLHGVVLEEIAQAILAALDGETP